MHVNNGPYIFILPPISLRYSCCFLLSFFAPMQEGGSIYDSLACLLKSHSGIKKTPTLKRITIQTAKSFFSKYLFIFVSQYFNTDFTFLSTRLSELAQQKNWELCPTIQFSRLKPFFLKLSTDGTTSPGTSHECWLGCP